MTFTGSRLKIILGGGSGFVGKRLLKQLQGRGHDVTVVSRKAKPGTVTWEDIWRVGLPNECNAVVNLAGENIMNPLRRWDAAFIDDIESSRIGTNKQLTEAISAMTTKPKVLVTTSAIGYYAPSDTKEYTETSPPGDDDYPSKLCIQWEAAAMLPSDCDVRQATLRLGLVLGREGGLIKNLYLPFYLGGGGRLGSGRQWFPWIHIDDVTGIFTHAVENEHVSGVLNAVAPGSAINAEFTQKLASAMWRPAILPMPKFVLKVVYGDVRTKMMVEGQKVLPAKTIQSGYKFIHPTLDSALADCVK